MGPQNTGPAAAFARAAEAAEAAATMTANQARAAAERASELFGFGILFKQKRLFRGVHGQLNPSLWRWYHRHGYWASRRKKLDFGTKRPHRYHQVEGDGRMGERYKNRFGSWWQDKSYYK